MTLAVRCMLGAGLTMGLYAAAEASVDPIIGSHWPMTPAFESPPPRAEPAPGSACEVANRYVTLVAADRGDELPNLFAEDGVRVGVDNRVLRGRAEIAAFTRSVHIHGVIPLSFIDRGRECIMEIAGGRPGRNDPPGQYYLLAIDHFTIGADGKIVRLVTYFRPGALPP